MEGLLVMGRFDFLEFFLKLFFGSREWHDIIPIALYMIGLWKMFEKSGVRRWLALIPGVREYNMGRCAGREH